MRPFLILLAVLIPAWAFAAPEVPASAAQVTLSFSPIVKQTAPAVVNIYTKRAEKINAGLSPLLADPFFKQFFGEEFGGLAIPRERIVSSLGSGVIVGADGTVVTNHHVIAGSTAIRVVLADKREFEAEIKIDDPKTDLAVLKIKDLKEPLPFIALGDSDAVDVGDLVLAVGDPFGVGQTVTQGIVSALSRTTVGISDYKFFIQTDAAINPGNSGGALVDMRGKLIGINTAIYSRGGGSNGVGFAIPSNMVASVMRGAVSGGKVVRPWLGASGQTVTTEIAESLGMKAPTGVLLKDVFEGGPAQQAGLRSGDILLTLGGKTVQDNQALKFRLATLTVDEDIPITYLRSGKEQSASLRLTLPPGADVKPAVLKGEHPLSGASVSNITPAIAQEYDLPLMKGAVITNVGKRYAARFGFREGDVVVNINGEPVTDIASLAALVSAPAPGWRVSYIREGRTLNLTIRP